jgi:hypothetical protein
MKNKTLKNVEKYRKQLLKYQVTPLIHPHFSLGVNSGLDLNSTPGAHNNFTINASISSGNVYDSIHPISRSRDPSIISKIFLDLISLGGSANSEVSPSLRYTRAALLKLKESL